MNAIESLFKMGQTLTHPPIKFKYLEIPVGGRGGACRFFFLAHGLKFDEELYDFEKEYVRVREIRDIV